MIKASQLEKPIIRTCQAPFMALDENGELKTYNIRVEYRTSTIKESRERIAETERRAESNPGAVIWISEILIKRLHRLPDILDENDQPVEITLEFLESLDVKNLKAIQEAIEADTNPK